MIVRPATSADAQGMSRLLARILAGWNSMRPSDPDHVRRFYIEHPDRVQCSVAIGDEGEILGFQSLRRATEGNQYGVSVGWGIIGTYVSPDAGRRGIGSALFAASRQAAADAGLPAIDATIGADNLQGLAYYEAMGFRTYRTGPGTDSKCYRLRAED
jgi:ribosomal protein S18 acetylase RimI-like enzyme